jgi:hypothetical protein
MEVSSQFYTLVGLPSGKESTVRSGWGAGWAPKPIRTLWSRQKSLVPAGNRTIAVKLVLYRLKYLGSRECNQTLNVPLSFAWDI